MGVALTITVYVMMVPVLWAALWFVVSALIPGYAKLNNKVTNPEDRRCTVKTAGKGIG